MNAAELTNHDFLETMRDLAFTRQGKVLRPVDYKNLGAEELGGVYESLLALTPQISADGARFSFAEFAGNERKISGSYYTPDTLVQCLLDSALDPVVEEAIKGKSGVEAEKAILSLKVCDPAVGSGHFLVGAAHRLARHLARVRALAHGDSEASPLLYQHALREVIGRCLYGVDVSPMAAELCRVSLWLEALEPGKPLSFLDHHIRVGNSLHGATPESVAAGIPDDAFSPILGDDKKACSVLRKRNRAQRAESGPLFSQQESEAQVRLEQAAAALGELPDAHPEEVKAKELAFRRHEQTAEYVHKKLIADTWCASFVVVKEFAEPGRDSSAIGITQHHLSNLADGKSLAPELESSVRRLAEEFQFFHWHLFFPEVFSKGGFDCVLGNPPWERVNLKEQEWFAERQPEIAAAVNSAARKQLIEDLRVKEPELYLQFQAAARHADGEGHFLHNSGVYPLCGRGDINLYAVFAERARCLLNPTGRVGCVLPSGIATDDTTKFFFQNVVETRSLVSLYDFENKGIFPEVHNSYKFCLFTSGAPKAALTKEADYVFFAHSADELRDPRRHITLSAEDIRTLNPNSKTCPIFANTVDAELTKTIYRRTPILLSESSDGNPWNIEVGRMFHTSDDSPLFRADETQDTMRLYEAKCFWQFDHRYASFSGSDYEDVEESQKLDPSYLIRVRYNIEKSKIPQKFRSRLAPWHLSFRKIARATDARTLVLSATPQSGLLDSGNNVYITSAPDASCLMASLNSFVVDYVSRQKIGGPNMTVGIISQLPNLPPAAYDSGSRWTTSKESLRNWILARVAELTYTAWDLAQLAEDLKYSGPPFQWSEERRFLLRCELDAAFFHLYLGTNEEWYLQPEALKSVLRTPRDAVSYVMDCFPIIKRKDEQAFDGDYRTKRMVLEIYDALAESLRADSPYGTLLSPSPAAEECRHPRKKVGVLAYGSLIHDPGSELESKIEMRIKTATPFPVEYGRLSGKTRGGAPTLVPHPSGGPVSAEVFILADCVTPEEAADMVWRRETRKVGMSEKYAEGNGADSVLVRRTDASPWVETLLYTDFHPAGKIAEPDAEDLATRAIASVSSAKKDMDGISYLMNAIESGIETKITAKYLDAILKRTASSSLREALDKARGKDPNKNQAYAG
ncbi:MAG TPA: N-6 DNA methylase [Bryobacteraceae bacterium]|nr:N-6 DNA methylase [Bryobacteraceae bacterium]